MLYLKNLLSIIKSGYQYHLQFVTILKYNKHCLFLLSSLELNGFIESFTVLFNGVDFCIIINLKYIENKPAMQNFKVFKGDLLSHISYRELLFFIREYKSCIFLLYNSNWYFYTNGFYKFMVDYDLIHVRQGGVLFCCIW